MVVMLVAESPTFSQALMAALQAMTLGPKRRCWPSKSSCKAWVHWVHGMAMMAMVEPWEWHGEMLEKKWKDSKLICMKKTGFKMS
jgi:hypothetical protein